MDTARGYRPISRGHMAGGTSCRQGHVRAGLADSARRLPEDHLCGRGPANTNCERFSRPRSNTKSIAAPRTTQEANRHPLHNLHIIGPNAGRMAVHLRGARPRISHLQHNAVRAKRKANQEWQRRPLVGISAIKKSSTNTPSRRPASQRSCPSSVSCRRLPGEPWCRRHQSSWRTCRTIHGVPKARRKGASTGCVHPQELST